jgi:antitoxin (DNA-binding transcriptional repressor) of toxin-antitoxin stability system
MEFVPYRVLRNEPSALRRKLEEAGELVVTVDGKPFAVMIDLSENENMDDILLLVARLRAQMAARSIRSQARRDGVDALNAEQIDDLIRQTRAGRKA